MKCFCEEESMKNQKRIVLAILLTLLALPTIANAQRRRRPTLRRPTPPVVTPVLVPIGTNLKVRLNDTLSSTDSRVGDRFAATVIDPVRFSEGTAHGHIKSILKSGKVQGRTTMNLAFDSIDLPGDPAKHGVLHGYVTRIYSTNAKTDEEGGVQSESRGKQTLKRSGIGATAGAIIGGIAGGGKGAAIGLILGGAGGAGSIAMQSGEEIKLESRTGMPGPVTR